MESRKFWNSRIETLSRDKLERLQLERLRRQIKRCHERSSFYEEKFKKAGVRPKHLKTLKDITKFPFVTKEELRDEQVKHPPFGRYALAPPKNWCELHPSSGTTGTPVNTIWSERDVGIITDVTARTMWSFGIRSQDIVQNSLSYGLWVAGLSVHYACKRIGCFVIPSSTVSTARQIEFMKNPGSTVLLATPSFALYIAERLKEQGIYPDEIPLRRGCFGGEAGTEIPSTRAKIEKGLEIDAYDYYGLAEIGPTFASECEEKAGLHWAEDHYLIEIVNPETKEPCDPGEVGVLVITHLTREATPMIHYWTNDYAKLDLERCRCGRTHARSLGGILGRADDLIIFKGAKFYPVQVEKVVRGFKELGDEYRIELTKDDTTGLETCTILVEYKGNLSNESEVTQLENQIREAIKEELLVTPGVKVLSFGTLERTAFKARRVEDKRK